jgi:hypothetical protein
MVLSGLTSKLESAFYPNYTFFNAREASMVRVEVVSSALATKKRKRHRSVPIWVLQRMRQNARLPPTATAMRPPVATVCPASKKSRTAEGRRLDREVLMTVEYWIGDKGLDLEDVVHRKAPASKLPSEAMRLKFEHDMREQSWHTQRLWRVLYEQGLEPVGSQVMVGVRGVGTLCDLVCWNPRTGKWVVVENKVGFDYWRYGSGGSMEEPFQAQTDCPLNQHLLQLAASLWLFVQTFGMVLASMETLLVRLHGVGLSETTRVEDHAWLVDDNFAFCERLCVAPRAKRVAKKTQKRKRSTKKTTKKPHSTKRASSKTKPAQKKKKKTTTKPLKTKRKKVASAQPAKRKKQRVA